MLAKKAMKTQKRREQAQEKREEDKVRLYLFISYDIWIINKQFTDVESLAVLFHLKFSSFFKLWRSETVFDKIVLAKNLYKWSWLNCILLNEWRLWMLMYYLFWC